MSGDMQVTAWIDRLRRLPGFVSAAAPELAASMEQMIARQISLGQGPDGAPWPLTKEGTQALRGAASALSVRAIGTVLLAKLTGHEVYHHYGTKRLPKRQILPSGDLPATIAEAFKRGLVKRFGRTMGGF